MTQNLLFNIGEMFKGLWEQMGIANGVWQNYVMLLISFVLFYLAIVKKFEPLLLLPIAFGMFIVNVPGAYDIVWGTYPEGVAHTYDNVQNRGLLWYLFYGVDKVIYPPLIFLGIGAMTDFGPLISNPKSMFIGAAAQMGIFIALILGVVLGFD
ncbi:MAG: sodium ion-translocating decarboxylase subunit beta, partial [Lachnospiraceae bacterium]